MTEFSEALDEKYLLHIASSLKIGLLDASLIMDECIKKTSATLNIDYSIIYNILFSVKNLKNCLLTEEVCDKLTVDQCIKSCNCFILEPYGCLSRKIKDVDLINEDPDKYIITHLGKTEDLKKMVNVVAYLYHNYYTDINDNSFDALEYHLRKREKIKERMYDKIGALPVEKIRTKLQYEMPSLNKIKPGTTETVKFLLQFQNNKNKSTLNCAWSLKLDGVSGMIIYKNNNLTTINIRGDGIIGGDVTYLKDYIKLLPKTINVKNMVVRGEFMITKDIWNKKYKGSYANARSFISAKINSGFITEALHDVEFVAYEIKKYDNDKNVPMPSQVFKMLESEGFSVVENNIFIEPTLFEIMETYKRKREESKYYIDGLVLSVDEPYLAAIPISENSKNIIAQNPNRSVAFKMQLEEQVRSTEVINVEWNISRYGRYVPVVIYKSVYVDGVRLSRATGHNARYINDMNLGKGAKIKVVRSGDVIPQIKDVEINPKIIIILPLTYEQGGYEYHYDKADIVLDEIDTNKEVLIKRIVHFFTTIEVPRLRQKTAEKMYEGGLTTPEAIVKSTVKDLIKIKGVGLKSGQFFYDKIREIMAIIPPDRFIVSSTTFKSGIGRKLLKQLFREIPNIMNLSEEQIRNYFKSHKLPGFGPSRIDNISKGIPHFREYLDSFAKSEIKKSIENYIEKSERLKRDGYNSLISGKKFVLTQFGFVQDYELEDYIYDNNGDFSSAVTSDVSAVIYGGMSSEISKKMIAASEFNIPVLSIQEFSERYNVFLKRFEKNAEIEEEED